MMKPSDSGVVPLLSADAAVTSPRQALEAAAWHEVVDDFLRKEMGLGPNDPVFALIDYIHPEMHAGTIKDLAGSMLKTEGGNTHMGAYVGKGRTTNSPETYHNNQWQVKGYPPRCKW